MSIELCKYAQVLSCARVHALACVCRVVGVNGGRRVGLTFPSCRPPFFTTQKQLTEIDEVPGF